MADQSTSSMALRYYNVGNWAQYYLAFPNYGKRGKSANSDCRMLAMEILRYVQSLTRSPEASLPRAPEKATVKALILLIRRANAVIGARLVPVNAERQQLPYNDPAYESHVILPVPLFAIENTKIREYATSSLKIVQAIYHHGDNVFQDGFTEKFRDDIWPEIKKVQKKIAIDLLNLPLADVDASGFLLDPEVHLQNYDPDAFDVSTEEWWTPSGVPRLSADDWRQMTQGIPTDAVPVCPEYPSSSPFTAAGGTGASSSSAASSGASGNGGINLDA
jgi:hypothetical protein